MTDITSRETLDRLSSSIEKTGISSTSEKDDKNVDVKDCQSEGIKEEGGQSSIVFDNGCVLNDDQDEYTQHIIKTIVQTDRKIEKSEIKEEDKKDAQESDKKPCLIRMFKGDELDENFVYTDHDMVSIISRIVNENIDCFEIEEVQTATYDRLKFFKEGSKVDAEPGWEEIVHKTPIQELFSMIEFLREHAQDSSEPDEPPTESPFLDIKSRVLEESSQVTETEMTDGPSLDDQERSPESIKGAVERLPLDHLAQKAGDAPLSENLVEKTHDDAATFNEEKGPVSLPPMEDQVKNVVVEDATKFPTPISDETSCANESKKHPVAPRPKVAPLDLSIESKKTKKSTKDDRPMSAVPLALSSKLDSALFSPLTTAKLREAIRPLEELYRRNGKDFEKLERLWAACAKDASSKCGFISGDTPLGQESAFGDGNPATPVC